VLRIRLTRMGKRNRPHYRIVVAEHSAPVKGKIIEAFGFYNPLVEPKLLEVKQDRLQYWISKGAKPSDTAASLLKQHGIQGMDDYIAPRNKKKKGKGEEAPAAAAPVAAPVAEEKKA